MDYQRLIVQIVCDKHNGIEKNWKNKQTSRATVKPEVQVSHLLFLHAFYLISLTRMHRKASDA